MRRLAFPVTAFLVMVIGALVLRVSGLVQRVADVQLLRLALTLVAAMAGGATGRVCPAPCVTSLDVAARSSAGSRR
jgi:multisubunit Na+/H+ antiporter MnhC subunit